MQTAYGQLTEALQLPEKPREARIWISKLERGLRNWGLQVCVKAECPPGSYADRSLYVISITGTPVFKPVAGLETIIPDDEAMRNPMKRQWRRVVVSNFARMELQLYGRAANNHIVGQATYSVCYVQTTSQEPPSQAELRLAGPVLECASEEFASRVHPNFVRGVREGYCLRTTFVFSKEGRLDSLMECLWNTVSHFRGSLNLAIERTYG